MWAYRGQQPYDISCSVSGFHQLCHVPPVEGSATELSPWFCRRCVFALAVRVPAVLCPLWHCLSPLSLMPPSPSLSEGGRPEEGSDSQGTVGDEAGPAVQSGSAELGLSASVQSAALLLLLRRTWRVRRSIRELSPGSVCYLDTDDAVSAGGT